MLEKIVKFFLRLLQSLRKQTQIPHSSEVVFDCKNVKTIINEFISKNGISELLYLISCGLVCISVFLLCVLFFGLNVVVWR